MGTNIVNIKSVCIMILICITQHLSNIWNSSHKKVKQHWACVKKSIAYKKTCRGPRLSFWLTLVFPFRLLPSLLNNLFSLLQLIWILVKLYVLLNLMHRYAICPFKSTLMQIWKSSDICLRMNIICWRFQTKTPVMFRDMRRWDMWKVCLQTYRNNRIT